MLYVFPACLTQVTKLFSEESITSDTSYTTLRIDYAFSTTE